MTGYDFRTQSARNRSVTLSSSFLLLLAFAVIGGYTVGKDRALRDNAREAAAAMRN